MSAQHESEALSNGFSPCRGMICGEDDTSKHAMCLKVSERVVKGRSWYVKFCPSGLIEADRQFGVDEVHMESFPRTAYLAQSSNPEK